MPCKKKKVYSRLVYIPPKAGEKFYARLILSVAKNLQSFNDLRRFNGVLYDTIREVCLACGLLKDDGEWRHCLDEAKHLQTGFILCSLFVVILRDCLPAEPCALWEEYKTYICDDLQCCLARLGIHDLLEDVIFDYGLYLIEHILLLSSNKTMKDVRMTRLCHDWYCLLSNSLLQDHLSFEFAWEEEQLQDMLPLLNDEQRLAFDCMLESFLADWKETFFIVGVAGAGKTFLYNTLCHAICSQSLVMLCIAYSGIAAQLLLGGKTAHSTFKILFDIMDNSICSILKNSLLAKLLKTASLLIWDECSAQHRFAFEAVDHTLCDLCDSDEMFGGITTILGGNFLQTLPVVKGNLRLPIVHACLLSSPLWSHIKYNILKLEKNMRVGSDADDQAFAVWLWQLATGSLNIQNNSVILPQRILCHTHAIADLISHVYPQIAKKQAVSDFKNHCILAPRNMETYDINTAILESFPGQEYELWAVNHALDPETLLETDLDYSPEVLHSFTPSGFPVAQLVLKIRCPVMVLQNLQPHEGVSNGSRRIVSCINTRILKVQLFNGATVLVLRIKLISTDLDIPFKLCCLQFPISLLFAMTINKLQGQTFDVVGINLCHPVFTHGQLYVALSRAQHFSSLKCLLPEGGKMKNIVFKEVVI